MLNKILFAMLSLSIQAQAQVWVAQNQWSEQSEKEFAEFTEKEFNADFFTNSNSVAFGIATDCADAMYIARTVFAWKKSLPVQFTHPSGGWITNNNTQWNHLPSQERLRAFLRYIGDLSNTGTLVADTYPIQISNTYLMPGVIYLSPKLSDSEKAKTGQSGGHVEIVKSVEDTGYIRMMGSTTPKLVQEMTSQRNPVHAPVVTSGGFRRFKQPQQFSYNLSSLPGYSLEQFTLAEWQPLKMITRKQIYQWNEAVRSKLRTSQPSFEQRVDVVVEGICEIFKSRVRIVKEAWSRIENRGKSCLRGAEWDDFSTPKKDARIMEAYKQLNDMYKWRKLEGGTHDIKDAKELLQQCNIEYWPGYSADTWELFLRMVDGRIVSDSNYSPAVRWGWKAKPDRYTCK